MTSPAQPQGLLLHRFLMMGQIALAAIFSGMTYLGSAPLMGSVDETLLPFTYVFVLVPVALVCISLLILKPKAPRRTVSQPEADFWTSPVNLRPILLVWFLLEGASVLSGVGFLLVGGKAPAIAMVLAIAIFWMNGPGVFDAE